MPPRKIVLIDGAALVLGLLGWYGTSSNGYAAALGAADSLRGLASSLFGSPAGGGGTNPAGGASGVADPQRVRREQLAQWRSRLERTEQVYASYRDATRYPPDSRPIAEHPDQVHPFLPIAEEKVLRTADGSVVKGMHLRSTQERVFVSGTETVKFSIQATDDDGVVLPMIISSAAVQAVADTAAPVRPIRSQVTFSDDGSGPDAQAHDGIYSALLNPAQQGFANYAGTIRMLVQVSVNGQPGVASFDVIYTPEVPATWAGVREAIEQGSLSFYLKANVAMPGRYVVSARVDDANGAPFALLQFNDEVAAGSREFKLVLFGALVRDKAPAFPLRLRDVDGYLLFPDKFPDRANMAREAGVVYTSASYTADRFSPDEWTSEEKARYQAEYGNDLAQARDKVTQLQSP